MRTWIRSALMLWLALTIAACNRPRALPSPEAPSPVSVPLDGFWVGTVGVRSDDGRPLGVIWSARESKDIVSGTATFSTLPPVAAQVTFVGPLTGTRNGDQLSLTYVATYGTVLAGTCALSGSGAATVGDGTLTGTLAVTMGSCDSLGLQPPTSMELRLTKQ